MLKCFWRKKKTVIVVVAAIVLSTLGIRATDNLVFLASIQEGFRQDDAPCPQDMVFVLSETGGFCIDKYQASPEKNCPYPDPQNQSETRENLNDPNCFPVSSIGAVPWTYISQDQAQLACAKAGKRLPTNEEWYLAALGTPDPNANWGREDCNVADNWENQPGLTGSGRNCVSAVGAYDMIGNVWEWVSGTIIDGQTADGRLMPARGYIHGTDGRGLPAITDPDIPDPNYNEDFLWIINEGVRSFMRGGYWDNQSRAGLYSVYLIYQPSSAGPGTGFRCVK